MSLIPLHSSVLGSSSFTRLYHFPFAFLSQQKSYKVDSENPQTVRERYNLPEFKKPLETRARGRQSLKTL
jgi:hypothetical protein